MTQLENMAKIGFAEILPLNTVTVPPYTTTNAVIYGDRSFVVIDPGSPDPDQQLLLIEHLSSRLARGQQFLGVFLTHHHGDHTKGALPLSRHFGVPIRAHKNAKSHLNFAFLEIDNDQEIIFVDDHLSLEARYTPGHADDHVVYYDEKNGVLIAGDMITDRGTVLIPPLQGDLSIYLESLEMLTRLMLKVVIPAHGQAIIHKPVLFLLKAMKHRYERIRAVLEALRAQASPLDTAEITHTVYGPSIPDKVMFFAKLSVESSLQWLQANMLVKKTSHRWQPTGDCAFGHDSAILLPLQKIDERLRNP